MEIKEIIEQLNKPGIRRIEGNFCLGNKVYDFKAYTILNPEPLYRIDVKTKLNADEKV